MKVIKFILKIIKSILGLFSDICFILLFVYGVTFLPFIMGYKADTVTSNDTVYKDGTLIYYKHVDLEELRVSDRLLEKKDAQNKIYTITDLVDDNVFVGDDKIVYDENVYKIASISIPYLGKYVYFMNHNKMVFFFLLAIIVGDLVLSGIFNKIKSSIQKK
ncbi:MAG: hypothetical protein IJI22_05925 [Bacilli bacterium]|nr:hypothetical protein [Bacilli bacterium]